jgi:hypothetical protein
MAARVSSLVARVRLALTRRFYRRDQLKIYAFKRYQDHRRFLAMERAYVSGKIRALAR